MSDKPWYLYIAESKSGKYYVGITIDVSARIKTHNAGRGSVMGRIDGPLVVRYVSQNLEGQSVARRLEIKIKKLSRDKKSDLIQGIASIGSYM